MFWDPCQKPPNDRLEFKDSSFTEQFLDHTGQKVLHNEIKRRVNSYRILMRINLEERRLKLRKLLFDEERDMIEKHEANIVTLDQRRNILKETARKIRLQKELERQEIVKEKYFLRDRLNSEEIRRIQQEKHLEEIRKDRVKLEDFKKRIKREEDCEKIFWYRKMEEQQNIMLAQEMNIIDKKNKQSYDLIEQMKEREESRRIERIKEKELNNYNREQAIEAKNQLQAENLKHKMNDLKSKENFRKQLDDHLRIKKCIEDKWKERNEAYDDVMREENKGKQEQDNFMKLKKKVEMRKHLENYIELDKCIEKQRKDEDRQLNEHVIKTQKALEKKRYLIELEKTKKYKDLIKSIKLHQKDQLKVAEIRKAEELKLKEEEKLTTQIQIDNALKQEKLEIAERKRKNHEFNLDLLEQIKFNDYLKQIRECERQREEQSMFDEEVRYQNLIKDIKEKEVLIFEHPWRKQAA